MIIQEKLKMVCHDDKLCLHPLWESIFLQIANVPVTIAPELKDSTLIAWKNVTLKCKYSPNIFQATAYSSTRNIVVHSGIVDGLWCMAVACYILREKYDLQSRIKDLTKEPLVFDPVDLDINIAHKYLFAAIQIACEGIAVQWETLPKLSDALSFAARQLTLSSLAFVLYHEFGHLTFRHIKPDLSTSAGLATSRLQESDADNFALDYILPSPLSVGLDLRAIAFRAWGVVNVTLLFSAQEVYSNVHAKAEKCKPIKDVTRRTHPLAYMRLDRVLKHSTVINTDLVKRTMYSAVCIPLYFIAIQNNAIPDLSTRIYCDMEALYEEVVDRLYELLASVCSQK